MEKYSVGEFRAMCEKEPERLLVVLEGWIIDLTNFAKFHPGGARILTENKHKDITEIFHSLHNSVDYLSMVGKHVIGKLNN